MQHSNVKRLSRRLLAAATVAALAFGTAASTVAAGGLVNCIDATGKNSGRVGCWEDVWSGGIQYRMTFPNQSFDGATPTELARFYVLAPQAASAQGPAPSFPHDHVIPNVPAGSASYTVHVAGFFVLCTEQGLISGDCVPMWMAPPGGPVLPFADVVAGGPLTSTAAIEAAAVAGNVALVDLGPNAVMVGTINPSK